jgi:hypothetical protein
MRLIASAMACMALFAASAQAGTSADCGTPAVMATALGSDVWSLGSRARNGSSASATDWSSRPRLRCGRRLAGRAVGHQLGFRPPSQGRFGLLLKCLQ